MAGANALGAAAGSIVSQGIEKGVGKISVGEVAAEAAVGAAAGKLAPGLKIPGVTSGRNSMAAVTKSNITKLQNGMIKNVSPSSVAKASISGAVGGLTEGGATRASEVTGATGALAGAIESGASGAANLVFRAGPEYAIPNTPLPPKEDINR